MSEDIPNINGRRDTRHNPAARRVKQRVYRSARWQAFRLAYLSRHPLCYGYPVPGECRAMATDVDHITGDMAAWKDADFHAYCHSCHSRKTRGEGV